MSNVAETPVRSPSYPAMPLADAVSAVRKIEAQYRSSKVDREAAAKIIGYSGLSGPANKALAALAQFGLVERAGKGEMRVTLRARAILHPDSPAEKLAELREAALEPQLFRDLQERWPAMIPPEDGVVMFLNRKGFNQTAIRPAAKAYLQTLLFLEEEGGIESHGTQDAGAPESEVTETEASASAMNQLATSPLMPDSAITPAVIAAAAARIDRGNLNRINMNIQGDKVHLDGFLDLKGLEVLEKKISALKILLAMQPEGGDAEESETDETTDAV